MEGPDLMVQYQQRLSDVKKTLLAEGNTEVEQLLLQRVRQLEDEKRQVIMAQWAEPQRHTVVVTRECLYVFHVYFSAMA